MSLAQLLLGLLLGRRPQPVATPKPVPVVIPRPAQPPATPGVLGPGETPEAAEFVALLNAERAKLGAGPLAWDATLDADAILNDTIQITAGLGHYTFGRGPNNTTVYRGQVAAWNAQTPEQVLADWRSSPGHWAILSDPRYTRIGLDHHAPYWTGSVA